MKCSQRIMRVVCPWTLAGNIRSFLSRPDILGQFGCVGANEHQRLKTNKTLPKKEKYSKLGQRVGKQSGTGKGPHTHCRKKVYQRGRTVLACTQSDFMGMDESLTFIKPVILNKYDSVGVRAFLPRRRDLLQ